MSTFRYLLLVMEHILSTIPIRPVMHILKKLVRTLVRTVRKTSNSFEFTSFWADANNKVIADLVDFTKTFFAKHTILALLTRYCVFTAEELLLVMRPYQIAATERIINRIVLSSTYKKDWFY